VILVSARAEATLLPEILSRVFNHLLAYDSTWALVQCMLCCKAWSKQAQYVLYKDLILDGSVLPRLLSSPLSTEATVFVQTLSLRLDPPEEAAAPQAISQLLINLANGHFRRMTSLQSLSIYQLPSKLRNGFMLPVDGLAVVLNNLPKSCTALEIESRYLTKHSFDTEDCLRNPSSESNIYLRPCIQKVLPQLRHLRLRLNTPCPDFYSTPKRSSHVLGDHTF
jgi:hypothetical protein